MHTSVHQPSSMERINGRVVIQVSQSTKFHGVEVGVCCGAGVANDHCFTGTENLNQWFTHGDVSYILICSAMVLIMVPGLGFLYSGLARRKSALSLIWACVGSSAVVTFQWYFWGYSLAFSSTATNGFIGDLKHFALQNTLGVPSPGSPLIPELLYSFYQMQFAAVTLAIVMGAIAERGRLLPAMVFTFFWTTIVYCPIACWVWNVNGWAFNYGVLDYAGMSPPR
jgi:Amt family ammonium transporter